MIEELQVCISQLVDAFYKKIGILEIAEQAKVEHKATGEVELFLRYRSAGCNEPSPVIIADNRKDQQDEKNTAGFVIKEKADEQEIDRARLVLLIDQGIDAQHHRKKSPEIQLRKNNGLAFDVKEVRL